MDIVQNTRSMVAVEESKGLPPVPDCNNLKEDLIGLPVLEGSSSAWQERHGRVWGLELVGEASHIMADQEAASNRRSELDLHLKDHPQRPPCVVRAPHLLKGSSLPEQCHLWSTHSTHEPPGDISDENPNMEKT